MKSRQISNPFKKGNRYLLKKNKQFLLSILTLFAVVFAIMLMQNLSDMFMLAGFGSTMFASMAIIGNVDNVSDRYTSGNDIAHEVYLIDQTQIDTSVPFPKPNANREVATIPLLSGEYMHKFAAHTKPTFVGTTEKGDITTTGTGTFVIVMGGNRAVLLNFLEEFAGGRFIVIYKEISTGNWFILGSYDDPYTLNNAENKHDADGRYVTFTFTRASIFQPCIYAGSITTVAPGNHTAGATALAISMGVDQYNIPNGTSDTYAISTLTGLTSSSKGRYITLIGQGTTHSATIADGASFVLEDGATWTASQNSRITFRVMDASTLVEISRVQA